MNLELWKKIKKEKKLTYDDIALKSGVSRRTVIRIFSDVNCNPTNFNIEAIEKALGIDLSQSNVNTAALNEKSTNTLTKKETRLLDAFNGLIPPMQDYVLEMVEKLVEKNIDKVKKV